MNLMDQFILMLMLIRKILNLFIHSLKFRKKLLKLRINKKKMKRIMNLWMKKEIEKILHFGKSLRKMNLSMNHHGVQVDLDGILNVLLCVQVYSLEELIYILEERILNFHIMIMKQLKHKLILQIHNGSTIGFILDI